MTAASNKLAKAQEVAAAKGLRAALPFYFEAADGLAAEGSFDAATGVLSDLLNQREKKRSLFGSKEINPLGPDRAQVAKRFAKATRGSTINDELLELLATLAAEYPDESQVRLANAEALYRSAYMADAIDEYRYCEQLKPDDGSLTARLGELYAIVSRNEEAKEYLRRGIARLREQKNFDGFTAFCLKLVEVDLDSAKDVHDWTFGLSDDVFAAQRADVTRVLDAVRERGADTGHWSDVEARLAELPEVTPPTPAAAEQSSKSAWDDSSMFEPASEDEMRLLLGPTPASEEQASSSTNGVAHELEESGQTKNPTADTHGLSVSTGRAQPTSELEEPEKKSANKTPAASEAVAVAPPSQAVGSPSAVSTPATALPPALAAFTRRKGEGALAAGDYQGAAACYERLLKAGFEVNTAQPLLECYLQLERYDDAATLGLQLADEQAESGETDKAVETLSKILKQKPNAQIEQRRSELLTASQA